ncbi:MAG: TlpA family protein disulfide reductase [Gammaproteobacteria bacterium]|nr:TlpA family protein disulfide reductase [Gammaproteobacteria bacterium]MYF37602.1 TlpA family protein disulfide reductase [Gammaproteobacteria bacterium]
MKKTLFTIGLVAITLILNGCQSQSVSTQTITHYSLSNESIRFVQGLPMQQPISISVSYEVADENNEVSSIILASGQLIDGELKLEQTVTEPTEVVIAVNFVTDDVTSKTSAILRPDSSVEFVVFDRVTTYGNYKQVLLKGSNHRSLDDTQKFSLKGNLSEIRDIVPELMQVRLIAEPSFPDYDEISVVFDPVLVDEGEFSIEGDITEPTLFKVAITEAPAAYFGGIEYLPAILEPGVNYRVIPLGNKGKHAVIADRDSVHTQLVSSWRLEPEYVTLVDKLYDDYLDAMWGLEREVHEEHDKIQIRNYHMAEQCDHINLLDEVKSRFVEPYKYVYQSTSDQLKKMRTETLRTHLRKTEDSAIARIIVDLNRVRLGTDWRANPIHERVAILEEFAQKMDDAFVNQFVTPRIDSLTRRALLEKRNSSLLPGQVAPNFTLTSISGDDVSLSEVLSKNRRVSVSFWRSDCDHCIKRILALKELYAEFKDLGFEVVTISIEDNLAEWKATSDGMNLPWINLGAVADGVMNGDSPPIVVKYGVFDLPNHFLIDHEGCILNKQFSNSRLKEMLDSRLVEIAN